MTAHKGSSILSMTGTVLFRTGLGCDARHKKSSSALPQPGRWKLSVAFVEGARGGVICLTVYTVPMSTNEQTARACCGLNETVRVDARTPPSFRPRLYSATPPETRAFFANKHSLEAGVERLVDDFDSERERSVRWRIACSPATKMETTYAAFPPNKRERKTRYPESPSRVFLCAFGTMHFGIHCHMRRPWCGADPSAFVSLLLVADAALIAVLPIRSFKPGSRLAAHPRRLCQISRPRTRTSPFPEGGVLCGVFGMRHRNRNGISLLPSYAKQ